MEAIQNKNYFRPRARILQQLGDQLIGTPRLAVFELVKNAYDADASCVSVTLNGLNTPSPTITIRDDGTGMSEEVIRNIWLVIAHDNREKQLKRLIRTPKGRLPLGAKGLGRLSVHKLGNCIELVTKAKDDQEIVVRIDWEQLMENEFLEDAKIDILMRNPEVFLGSETGTQITISELRSQRWTRGEVRRLYRQVTSISSPFGGDKKTDFEAKLEIPSHPQWIEKLPDTKALLGLAPWKFSFKFDGNNFEYEYTFRKIPGILREGRTVEQSEGGLLIPPPEVDDDDPLFSGEAQRNTVRKVIADLELLKGIGPISGEFYAFDLSPKIASRMGEIKLIKDFLDENGGVRVYRDGIRVYDYGEPSNDWLGLDLKRVNNPTRNLSRNILVGHISISQEASDGLIEKSNREGFIENSAYERFQRIVIGAIDPLQREREVDRKAIRELTSGARNPELQYVTEPVGKIRIIAQKNGFSGQIDPLLDRIESEYAEMKERLLTTGISGTSLAVVFHEIEAGVHSLYRNLKDKPEYESITGQVREMLQLLDGFSDLLRKRDRKPVDLNSLVKRARDLNLIRFRHHNVKLVCPSLELQMPRISANCSYGLTLGALTNVIDNAIFWLQARWPEEDAEDNGRAIYISVDPDFERGPAIIIADTGPGLEDTPADLIRPFYTRRPGGMGMGLYFANMVMHLNDGELLFPDRSEVEVPDKFDGAIIALRFANLEEV